MLERLRVEGKFVGLEGDRVDFKGGTSLRGIG